MRKLLTVLFLVVIVGWFLWRLRRGPADRDPGLPAAPGRERERERFIADVEAYLEEQHGTGGTSGNHVE